MNIIVSHSSADFDSLAAMVAAQKIYPEAELVLTGSLNKNVREFLSLHGDVIQLKDIKSIARKEIHRVIVVDTRIAERLGEVGEIADAGNAEVFTFDHHPRTEHDIKGAKDYSELTGATTTILVKIIREKGMHISPFEATLFALGIHEDTGSLTYATTTCDDAEALTFLMKKRANIKLVNSFLNLGLSREQHALLNEFLENIKNIHYGGLNLVFSRAKVKEFVDGASVVTHKICDLENGDIVVTILESEDKLYVIGRSRLKEVNMAWVMESLGGGGHPQAASAVVRDASAAEIEKKLLKLIKHRLENPLRARDIMSKPVRSVSPRLTIEKAGKIMIRYGHSGLPVVQRGKIVGLLTRKEIDKAVYHGLSHAPVKGFMSRNITTVTPAMTLYDLQEMLVEKNIGRLPVVEGGRVIGIVTRTDVLKALHGIDYLGLPEKTKYSRYPSSEIDKKMRSLFKKDVLGVLDKASALAEKESFKIFLVGGIVRDIILGEKNLDLDLVIEGDGIRFARRLAAVLGGRSSSHKKFGTSVIILKNKIRIDIASARTEFYEHPAALPEVEKALLKHDLGRRDFTINAMAISLNRENYLELMDFYGGLDDLENKKVRVLHSLSFVEDPTRILRAVRFEQRYGFRIEKQTENLIKKAVEMELIDRIMGVRLKEELIDILKEDNAYKALQRLKKLHVITFIHPQIKLNEKKKKLFERLGEAQRILSIRVNEDSQWLSRLMILLSELNEREVRNWAFRLKLKKGEINRVSQALKYLHNQEFQKNLAVETHQSRIYNHLKELNDETLMFIYLNSGKRIKDRISLYMNNLKDIKTVLNGRALIQMGFQEGPEIGKIFKKLSEAKLDGKISDRKEEKLFVLKMTGRKRR